MLSASCGMFRSAAGATPTGAGAVTLTPPREDPGGLVLAVATATAGASSPPAGSMPAALGDPIRDALLDAYRSLEHLQEGKNADYAPSLTQADPNLYGLALVTVQGAVYEIGSSRHEFPIAAVSKPFATARAIDTAGAEAVRKRVGLNATGQRVDSILAVELGRRAPAGNSLTDAGAMATIDLMKPGAGMDKWNTLLGNLQAFAGRILKVDEEVYRSATEANFEARALAGILKRDDVIKGDPNEALDLAARQEAVGVDTRDLAIMGATLANGGRNPVTDVQVVTSLTAEKVLALLSTAGLAEASGDWLFEVGAPGSSGVTGGFLAVVPGRFAVASFSPPLDADGNSVRGQRALAAIVQRLGGSLFAVHAAPRAARTGADDLPLDPARDSAALPRTPMAGKL